MNLELVCIIPARGGSRRIPRKNIRMFHGKPIIAYSIEFAQNAAVTFDRIIVSTDDPEIAAVAASYGASVLNRPAELARDEVGTQEVVQHTIQQADLRLDARVLCLYPCAPLLTTGDISVAGVMRFYGSGAFVVTVGTEPHLHDAGAFYYALASDWLVHPIYGMHTRLLVLPPERVCDVNTEEDWQRCEQMYAALQANETNGRVH